MGFNRAGFYGYKLFENLGSKNGIRSVERIIPGYQMFKVGDPVPVSAVHTKKFYAVESFRYLIWTGQENYGRARKPFVLPSSEDYSRLIPLDMISSREKRKLIVLQTVPYPPAY